MKNRKKSQKDNITLDTSKSRKKSHDLKFHSNNQKNNIINPIKHSTQLINQKNDKQQAKKYLQKTLNILSNRFKHKNNDKSFCTNMNSILNLSSSVYKIVKDNLSINKQNNSRNSNIDSSILIKNNKGSNKMLKSSTQVNYYPINQNNQNTNISYHSKIKDQIQNQFLMTKLSSSRDNNNNDSQKNSRQVIISQKQKRTNSAMNNYSSILDASSICPQQNSNLDPEASVVTGKRRSNSTLDNYFRQKFGTNADDQQAVQKKLRVLKALKKSQQIVNKSNKIHVKSSLLLSNCDINDKSIVIDKLRSKKSQNFK